MSKEILVLLYDTDGVFKRDLWSSSLIGHHLEKQGFTLSFAKIEDLYTIDLLRPAAILLPDTYNPENMVAARYARQRQIPVITFDSEVSYHPTFFTPVNVWGWNITHEPLEDLALVAGDYSRRLAIAHGKDPARVVVGGLHRLDLFKLMHYMDKKTFLTKFDKSSFKSVVGYAAWGFDWLMPKPLMHPLFEYYYDRNDPTLVRMRLMKDKIRAWLSEIIQSMPDVLFILKVHPASVTELSEVAGLGSLPNVLLLHRQIVAFDLISACDVWMAWNSTTLLESFAFNKPVIFPRLDEKLDDLSFTTVQGAHAVTSSEEAKKWIAHYLQGGTIPAELLAKRDAVIKEVAVSFDGQNSHRAADQIARFLNVATIQSNALIDWAFLKSWIRMIRRRVATVLTDGLGLKMSFLTRWAGPNRFSTKVIQSCRCDIDKLLRSI